MYHQLKLSLFSFIHLGIIISLLQAPTLRAQSDLDLIQAIASKDIPQVSMCMDRQIDPNRLYGGETSLMIAVKLFGETLKTNAKQQDEATLLKNAWQFVSGAGLFTAGLGVTGVSGLSFWELKNEREQVALSDQDQTVEEPATYSSSGDEPVEQGFFGQLKSSVVGFVTGLSAPADDLLDGSDTEFPGNGGLAGGASSSNTPLTFLVPPRTIREVHNAIVDIRKGTQDTRLIIKIITIAVLTGSTVAGVIVMTRGVPRAINGLFNTVAKPFQTFSHIQEVKALKKIIYLILQQEQINLDVQSDTGETALDIVERLMLEHIGDKALYQELSEIEQLIKVRHIVS